MKRLPLMLIGALVLLVGGKFILNAVRKSDDKAEIQAALTEAIKASKEGRPGSVVAKLAENFKVNEQRADVRTIADFVKNNHPEVAVKDDDPVISGDVAQITSDIDVKVGFLGNSSQLHFKDVQIQFKKEPAMDWFIFPTAKWQLSAVRVNPDDIPGLPIP